MWLLIVEATQLPVGDRGVPIPGDDAGVQELHRLADLHEPGHQLAEPLPAGTSRIRCPQPQAQPQRLMRPQPVPARERPADPGP
jgi:hypothetical protein